MLYLFSTIKYDKNFRHHQLYLEPSDLVHHLKGTIYTDFICFQVKVIYH